MLHVTNIIWPICRIINKGSTSWDWTFQDWRKHYNKVRFADDTAIIAETHEELQNMVNSLLDPGMKYDMEISIDKSQLTRVYGRNGS